MNRGLAVGLVLLLVSTAGAFAQSEPKDAVQYKLVLACPGSGGVLSTARCPIEAWDSADALGSPAIAVDPDNVNNMIFSSLHGTPASGPEERSRSSQQFTTHTSTDHGASWLDMPYFEPDGLPSGSTGEHPGIALDPYGHVFISSLYSVPADGSPSGRDYVIAAQKFADLSDINANQNGNYNQEFIQSAVEHNRIGQTWFVYDVVSDNVVLLWNEQRQSDLVPAESSDPVAVDPRAVSEALLGADEQNGTQSVVGRPGAIAWAWTSADVSDPYHIGTTSVIYPCSTSTNPVVSEGWVYVGCMIAPGQGTPGWSATAKVGEIHMFRFRPKGGVPEFIGVAPLSGGAPKLGVRSDGRIALMTTEVVDVVGKPTLRLDGVFGQYEKEVSAVVWGEVHQYGPQLQILYANMPLVETNIQDMIYREYSGVVHLIFKRVADWPSDQPYGYRPEYFKAIVAIDEHYGLLAEFDLGIGDELLREKDSFLNSHRVSTYNDVADDFLELPPVSDFRYQNRPLGEHYQREFYAVGNYGFVHFAEVIEITELRGPAAAGLPNPPPPPNPAPATASTLALGLSGALTTSAIFAVNAARNKRKSTVRAGRKPLK